MGFLRSDDTVMAAPASLRFGSKEYLYGRSDMMLCFGDLLDAAEVRGGDVDISGLARWKSLQPSAKATAYYLQPRMQAERRQHATMFVQGLTVPSMIPQPDRQHFYNVPTTSPRSSRKLASRLSGTNMRLLPYQGRMT